MILIVVCGGRSEVFLLGSNFRQALAKDLDDARQASRTAQKKMAETASELYQSRQSNKELESENNRLQNKLKDLNEEYKSRLVRYVDDIAVSSCQITVTANASQDSEKHFLM